MKEKSYGIVIKVKDLNVCRSFYRDILELGHPLEDSTFWVAFQIGSGVMLYLEKVEFDEPLPPRESRIAWFLDCSDPEAFRKKLVDHGYIRNCTCADKAGFPLLRFTDPEGNPFYLRTVKE
ncbi:MAG: hypothetical protein J6W81_06835 [Lentisphaeria bacterium]|nr:hypothetical protein [Lentisphaeria bacterium]